MWNRTPRPNPCASTCLASLGSISDLCAPPHLFGTPTPCAEPVSSYTAFRKLGSMFFPTMSGFCLWPSPDFFNKCPSLPRYSCSPLSCFWDFCFPHVPVSSVPEVVCLTTIHHLQSQCHCTAHSYTISSSLILCLFGLYMLYVRQKYVKLDLLFFFFFSHYLECYISFSWFITHLSGKIYR